MTVPEPREETNRMQATVNELFGRHTDTVQQAWMELVYVMPPAMRHDVVAEVQHRRTFMGEAQAVMSVRDDLATGRWQP